MENYNQIQYVIGKDERHQEDNWWVNQWKKSRISFFVAIVRIFVHLHLRFVGIYVDFTI